MNYELKRFAAALLLVFIFTVLTFSFTSRKKEFVPPGTVKYNDTLFVDETEVSNFSWREYEGWMRTKYGKNSLEHKAALPDTLVWVQKHSYNEPYSSLYYWHPAYRDYPVVGISYEQAVAFCKWRTERVKDLILLSKKNFNVELEYRLQPNTSGKDQVTMVQLNLATTDLMKKDTENLIRFGTLIQQRKDR